MRTSLIGSCLSLLWLAMPAAGQEKIDLRLRPAKGDVRHVKVTLDQTIDQTVRNAKQETTQRITVEYSIKVEDVDDRGAATIAIRYESVSFHAKTPTENVDYDSTGPPVQPPPVASGMAALVGQGFSAVITAQGEVTQVLGVQKMLDAILSRMNLQEGMARTAAEKVLRVQLNERNLKLTLQNLFAPFAGHPVAIGEQWAKTALVNMGFPITVESTYTFESSEGGVATIKVEGKAATTPNASMDLGGLKMTYDLSGDQSGSLRITQSNGWTQTSQIDQRLTGSATIRGPNTDPQTVPILIVSRVSSEQK